MKILYYILAGFLYTQVVMSAPLRVVTTYAYIADITEKIGGERIQVTALARGDYNPHVIIPKPSYIAKVRNADLLIINGAQLEIGWLPPLLNQANNGDIQPGEKGFLDLSTRVQLIDVPTSVSRAQGDVHPDGNPHYSLNPDNIPIIAKAITGKLCELDPDGATLYQTNYNGFVRIWEQKMNEWSDKLKSLQGVNIVEYHKIFDYFLHRFGLVIAGTVEPIPGIPPTTKHIAQMEKIIDREKVNSILQDVYNSQDASKYLSRKLGVRMIVLPHDVGSVKEADGIIALFDEIVRRLTQ